MNKKVTILVVSIIAFLVAVGGLTYAYIRSSKVQTNPNTINTLTCLDLSLESKDSSGNATNAISLTNAYAIPDNEGLKGSPYIFTVTNNCTSPITVDINLETLSTSTLSKQYVKFNIQDNDELNVTKLISAGDEKDATITNATSNNLTNIYLSSTGKIGSVKTYELRIWINEATTWEQAHSGNTALEYQGKIVVVGSPAVTIPNSDLGTNVLKEAILASNLEHDVSTTLTTTPGQEISGVNEKVFASTTDDYGTSYYYRGNIPNNYLIFAGKCWRIVRITGNGAIKLFLWNNAADCTANYAATKSAFSDIKIGTETNSTADYYNRTGAYTSNRPAGVGLMYGDAMGSTYATVHANTNDSTILTVLKYWYDATFSATEKNQLADVIWCNDKSLASNSPSTTGADFDKQIYFKARERIYADGTLSNAAPTLVCPNAGTDNKLSKFTASDTINGNGALNGYKIGLLTADEVAFAGGAYNIDNSNYYLYTGEHHWLLSPSFFYTGHRLSRVWRVNASGYLNYTNVSDALGVRPSVALPSTTTITKGDGTIDNPYVVSI